MKTQVFELGANGLQPKKEYDLPYGQVIFLNGYGQNERHHKRIAVYEVGWSEFYDAPEYKTVNLDDFTLRTIAAHEVEPAIDMTGAIGLYFKEGELATKEEIDAAVIKGNELAQAHFEARAQANKKAEEVKAWSDAWFKANTPSWAKAVIIAEHEVNQSDAMTDYFGSRTDKRLLLAFSSTDRNNFTEFRQAAKNAAETAELADLGQDGEHRENYTGGAGYYLGRHRYSGWKISKERLGGQFFPVFADGDIRIPKQAKGPAKQTAVDNVQVKLNKKLNGIELYFPSKPDQSVLDELNTNGWRWSRFNACWYRKDTPDARAQAAKYAPVPEETV